MRKKKRRTHKKAALPTVATCSTTGERHLYHRAYRDADGNLYYRGKMIVKVEEEDL